MSVVVGVVFILGVGQHLHTVRAPVLPTPSWRPLLVVVDRGEN